jgi:nucleotide-binding universal stress UspA family protein
MGPIERILFPVDFSARSAHAAQYAAALAGRFEAELNVLHVGAGHLPYIGVNDVCVEPSLAVDIAWNEVRHKQETGKMTEFVSSHLRGVPAKACILTGDVAKVIVQYAHAEKSDLIVMPTHGFGGFRLMLLGSVIAKVLHDANCAVFTSAHVESASLDGGLFRTVLCAVDLGSQNEQVLRWAADFSYCVGAKLILVNIVPDVAESESGDAGPKVQVMSQNEATERLKQLAQSVVSHADARVESGAVVRQIKALAKRQEADLIVIGRHHGTAHLIGLSTRRTPLSANRGAPSSVWRKATGSLRRFVRRHPATPSTAHP